MAEDEADAPVGPSVPLDEFCQTLSQNDRRVELIAVFRFREIQAGRMHDTAEGFRGRYDDTHNSPTAGNALPVST